MSHTVPTATGTLVEKPPSFEEKMNDHVGWFNNLIIKSRFAKCIVALVVLYFVFQFISDNFGVNAGQFDSIFHWLDTQQAAFIVALAGVVFYLVFIRNSATDSARDGLAETAAATDSRVQKNAAKVDHVILTNKQLEAELDILSRHVTELTGYIEGRKNREPALLPALTTVTNGNQ